MSSPTDALLSAAEEMIEKIIIACSSPFEMTPEVTHIEMRRWLRAISDVKKEKAI